MSAPAEKEGRAGEATARKAHPLPWNAHVRGRIAAADGRTVALVYAADGHEHRWAWECERETEALIVRAVNNHATLRDALTEAVETDADVVQALRTWHR